MIFINHRLVKTLFYVAIYHLEKWYVPIIVISVSKIAQNYWHSLHLNWKDSNFKFLPTFLILDLSVSCVSWTGLTVTKCKIPRQSFTVWVRSESGLAVASCQQRRPRPTKPLSLETLDPIVLRQTENGFNARHRGQFHHSASYHLEEPRIYINIEHFR